MKALQYLAKGDPLPFAPGVEYGMSRERYEAFSALNQSILKKWIQMIEIDGGCPKKFKHWLDTRNDGEKSDALIIGSAIDCMLLEPDSFHDKFIIVPNNAPKRPTEAQIHAEKPSPKGLASIAFWKEFEENAAGKDILTPDQSENITRMLEAIGADEKTNDIFKHCKKAVLQAELNGIPCKGEIDLFSERTEFIFDVKTARTASLKPFSKAAWELGYHYQAAFYIKLAQALGLEKKAFCFVVVENVPPHCVATYTLDFDSDAMQYAWKMIQEASRPFTMALERNKWPDFTDFTPLKFPGWAKHEAVDFLIEA